MTWPRQLTSQTGFVVDSRRRHDQPAPGAAPIHRLRRQAELTIGALRASGRLEPGDALLVALVRTTAEVADERRDDPTAAYHLTAALRLLADLDVRLRTLAVAEDDAFADLLAAAQLASPAVRS
jgi:hypothetical protein